jgi:hypothetical protein
MPDEQEELQQLDGPDPRTWPSNHDIWGLVQDLSTLDHVTSQMDGGGYDQDGMSEAYYESLRLLQAFRVNRREQLALMLLSMYGVVPSPDAGTSPFAAAGKPRAFGADTSPPGGNLPAWQGSRQPDGSGSARSARPG